MIPTCISSCCLPSKLGSDSLCRVRISRKLGAEFLSVDRFDVADPADSSAVHIIYEVVASCRQVRGLTGVLPFEIERLTGVDFGLIERAS